MKVDITCSVFITVIQKDILMKCYNGAVIHEDYAGNYYLEKGKDMYCINRLTFQSLHNKGLIVSDESKVSYIYALSVLGKLVVSNLKGVDNG